LLKAAYFDITAIMELLKGGKNILPKIEAYREFYTGANTAAQLVGMEEFLVEKKVLKAHELRGLLDSLNVLPFTKEDAEKAGEILGQLKAAGKNVSLEEARVVAQCIRRGLTLITNRNLKDFEGLKLKEDRI